MTENLSQPATPAMARGPRGPAGVFPAPLFVAGVTYPKNTLLTHLNSVWLSTRETTAVPSFTGSTEHWSLLVDGRLFPQDRADAIAAKEAAIAAQSAAEIANAAAQGAAVAAQEDQTQTSQDAAAAAQARADAEAARDSAAAAATAASTSAASISVEALPFKPLPGAAFTRPVASKLRDWLSVNDVDGWGVSAAGNRAAINTALALAEAQGIGTVRLPRGSFDTVDDIILTSGVSLVSDGSSTRLQNVGSSTYHVRAEGALGATVALLSNAARGDTGLEVASTAGWAPGDYLLLGNTIEYAAAVSPNYMSGEMTQIAAIVDATHVTLAGKIYGSWQAGGAYAVADGANVRRVSPIIRPAIEGVELASDYALPTQAIQFAYALGGAIEAAVRDYGHSAIMLRGCIDSRVVRPDIRNLRDDVPSGRAGYGVVVAGPCMGVSVQDGIFSRCRHAFTTIGGVTGMPHGVIVSGNLAYDTSSTSFDTHAAGEDVDIIGNAAYRSGGSGLTFRSRKTRLRGNTVAAAASHGIAGAEANLSDIDIDGNRIKDVGGHGIVCDPSCPNLHITRNDIDGAYASGVRVFGAGTVDSTGLVIASNGIRSIGLGDASASGVITQGAVASTGALITKNDIAAGAGTPAYAIRTLALTGSAVILNSASGAFSSAVFSVTPNVSFDNRRIDGTVDQIQLDPTGPILRVAGPSASSDLRIIPTGTGVLRHGTGTAATTPASFSATHRRREKLDDGTVIYIPYSLATW